MKPRAAHLVIALSIALAVPACADFPYHSNTGTFDIAKYGGCDYQDGFSWKWNGPDAQQIDVDFDTVVTNGNVMFRLISPDRGEIFLDAGPLLVANGTNATTTINSTNIPPYSIYNAEFSLIYASGGVTNQRTLARGMVERTFGAWDTVTYAGGGLNPTGIIYWGRYTYNGTDLYGPVRAGSNVAAVVNADGSLTFNVASCDTGATYTAAAGLVMTNNAMSVSNAVLADAEAGQTAYGWGERTTDAGSGISVTVTTNLGVRIYTIAATGSGTGDMLGANNLSEIVSAIEARENLGLGLGTNVQAYSINLDAWALVTTNAYSLSTEITAEIGEATGLVFIAATNAANGYANGLASNYATAAQGTSADTAFGWGDHGTNGYVNSAAVTNIVTNMFYTTIVAWVAVPVATNSPGTAGMAAYNGTHLYICPVANTWRRLILSAW